LSDRGPRNRRGRLSKTWHLHQWDA
jgi:hypothetical protein